MEIKELTITEIESYFNLCYKMVDMEASRLRSTGQGISPKYRALQTQLDALLLEINDRIQNLR